MLSQTRIFSNSDCGYIKHKLLEMFLWRNDINVYTLCILLYMYLMHSACIYHILSRLYSYHSLSCENLAAHMSFLLGV